MRACMRGGRRDSGAGACGGKLGTRCRWWRHAAMDGARLLVGVRRKRYRSLEFVREEHWEIDRRTAISPRHFARTNTERRRPRARRGGRCPWFGGVRQCVAKAARLQMAATAAAGRLLLDGEIQGDGRKALGLTVEAMEGVYSAAGVFASSARSRACAQGWSRFSAVPGGVDEKHGRVQASALIGAEGRGEHTKSPRIGTRRRPVRSEQSPTAIRLR